MANQNTTSSRSEYDLWAEPPTVVIGAPQRPHVHAIHAVTMVRQPPPFAAPSFQASIPPHALTLAPPPMTYGRRETPTTRTARPAQNTSHEALVAVLLCGALALVAALTASISYAAKHRATATTSAPATARTPARVAVVEAAAVLISCGSREGRAPASVDEALVNEPSAVPLAPAPAVAATAARPAAVVDAPAAEKAETTGGLSLESVLAALGEEQLRR